jgi:hypothetical protein
MVMNARRIARCISAIESLPIDKVWMSMYWEKQLEAVIGEIISDTSRGHTHLILLSDDTVPSAGSLKLVLDALEQGYPVATGYCNLDAVSPFVNLTSAPFAIRDRSVGTDYKWLTRAEVESYPDPIVPTYFGGACLTGMSRAMWSRFPFRAEGPGPLYGYASDWNQCIRLQDAGVPIVAPRGAFVEHVKEVWNAGDKDPEKRLLIGEIPSEVRYDLHTK